MLQVVVISVLVLIAFFGAIAFAIFTVGGLQVARKAREGILQYFFYFLFFGNAMSMLSSGRTFDENAGDVIAGGALGTWAIRLSSLFVLMASLDQVVRYLKTNPKIEWHRAAVVLALLVFWLTNTLLPTFYSAHPVALQLKSLYIIPLVVGLMCMSLVSAEKTVEVCRNALVIVCVAGLLLIPIKPNFVLEFGYSQGYIPGLPRLAGLAPHAVALGLYATIPMWILIAKPMSKPWLNRIAWVACGLTLFLSQSKTNWVTFLLGVPVMLYYRPLRTSLQTFSLSQLKISYGLVVLGLFGLALGGLGFLLVGSGMDRVDRFLGSSEGAQLLSLTGRDKIWAVALREWHNSPIFGYGLTIFSPQFRAEINMPAAYHGHNQLMDALGRTGSVGAAGMLLYFSLIFYLGLRYVRETSGLSAVVALAVLLRAVTEVPISSTGIGSVSMAHYLLVITIAAGIGRRTAEKSHGATRGMGVAGPATQSMQRSGRMPKHEMAA